MTSADMAGTALAFLSAAAAYLRGLPRRTHRRPGWVEWAEGHGFTDWERYGYSLPTFQDEYGPLDEQPYPISQFVVHDAACSNVRYRGEDPISSVFTDTYGTGIEVGALLEQRLGMSKTKRMLAPLLREMEKRAEMDESGQDAVLLDRVRAITRLLDDGFTVSDIIAMLEAAPTSAVAIFALRNGVPVEYAAAVAN